jgi:hypothetical protein
MIFLPCAPQLELLTPLAPKHFLLFASVANVAKGLAGIINGAARASFNKNFSITENLGDVTAKAQTQGIVSYLIGMSTGIGISLLPGTLPTSSNIFVCFGVLAVLHLYCSYRAIKSVQLKTLNMQRANLLIEHFFHSHEVLSPAELSKEERIITRPTHLVSPYRILLGATLQDVLHSNEQQAERLSAVLQLFHNQKYLLTPAANRILVVLHENSDAVDTLRAYYCAHKLQALLVLENSPSNTSQRVGFFSSLWKKQKSEILWESSLAMLRQSKTFTDNTFNHFMQQLEAKQWNTVHLFLNSTEHRASW